MSHDVFFAGSSRIFRGFRGARHLWCPAAPEQIGDGEAGSAVNPRKDIDCMNPENLRKIFTGDTSAVALYAGGGVIETLKFYGYEIRGKMTIVNRSLVLGKPLSMLFLNEHATVTVCHSRSETLPEITSKADILGGGRGKTEIFRQGICLLT